MKLRGYSVMWNRGNNYCLPPPPGVCTNCLLNTAANRFPVLPPVLLAHSN